ncbi:hypothetical protein B0J13DRAFT_492718 [Dactylonectria estremocensis]|uniref:DUF7136 domain-containing protein n=1 Tax=Dactylonectria estremocensis TaxID=1079267 RepID=A0A9P9FEN9_9HYPO|nr:hypothetical protein B0J13DRAFT_492718 [Dactylonectria estremocensis]
MHRQGCQIMHPFRVFSVLLVLVAPAMQHQLREMSLVPVFPFDVEVALLFPRPNETYRAIYPFPIVFAISSAVRAWPYGLFVRWYLTSLDSYPYQQGDFGDLNDTSFAGVTSGFMDPAVDPYYAIAGSGIVSSLNASQWELHWQIDMLQYCSYDLWDGHRLAYGTFNFSVASNGSLPTITTDSCPVNHASFRVLDAMLTPDEVPTDYRYSNTCVVVESQRRSSCNVSVGPELEQDVAAKMLNISGCSANATWPDPENITGYLMCGNRDGVEDEGVMSMRISRLVIWAGLGACALSFLFL